NPRFGSDRSVPAPVFFFCHPERERGTWGAGRRAAHPSRSLAHARADVTSTTKEGSLGGLYYDERAFGSWRALRSSDQALESEDEEVHLRQAQRDLHHRSAENAKAL